MATMHPVVSFLFFFNDTATTEIYTLSLHDALPIYHAIRCDADRRGGDGERPHPRGGVESLGRVDVRSEEHTSELQSQSNLVCRLLLEKKKRDGTDLASGSRYRDHRAERTVLHERAF